jgi:hypothetical protein
MGKTVTISDDLAVLLEARRKEAGYPSLDATAEALIAQGLIADDLGDDHSDGRSQEELRALIDDAEASGPEAPWGGAAVRPQVLRRYAARGK